MTMKVYGIILMIEVYAEIKIRAANSNRKTWPEIDASATRQLAKIKEALQLLEGKN